MYVLFPPYLSVPTNSHDFEQWIEINWKAHPSYKTEADHQAIQQAILASAVDHKVSLMPGTCFWSDVDGAVEGRMFFRATFASASKDDLGETGRRFGDALRSQVFVKCFDGLERESAESLTNSSMDVIEDHVAYSG